MNLKLRAPIAMVIAIATSLIVLAGYLFATNAAGEATLLGGIRETVLQIAMVLAAVALFIGIKNLIQVHLAKI
ncbi:MAG: hypothetical protein GWN86_04160, partial [Desulfobacterales bacterium]|nr:hypothetical protein [Desulfobacterales bacterium]